MNHRAIGVGGLAGCESASAVGLQITYFAVPLIAIERFNADAVSIGALNLMDSIAALLFGLVAGNLIDRAGGVFAVGAANVLRASALCLLGVALVNSPQMWMLYVTMLLVGIASLTHEAGLSTAVQQLGVRSSRSLNRVNALLRGSSVVAELAGPGLAGVVVVLVGFGAALIIGGIAFAVAAAVCVAFWFVIDRPSVNQEHDSASGPEGERGSRFADGLRFIFADRVLRDLTLSSTQFNLFSAAFQAVFLIYCVRVLDLGTPGVAVLGVAAGIGGLLGSFMAASGAVARRQKTWYLCALGVPAVCVLAIVGASSLSHGVSLVVVAVAEAVFSSCMVLCIVLFNTLRQMRSPEALAGRIAASERVLALAGEVPGALLGGFLGVVVGVHAPMVIAAVGMSASLFWVLRVPDWSERRPLEPVGG
ncbi:MFS transporter [Curtobacterium sp. VKM Ac-2922]|uniref:MFS transporter n=1 Tax=Curtobacterium sp. VKM Ac-2922 TaxID=2929475 RepID=UPI001FB323C7|nr:MFS transporter [Curtobacterium sp. VKM Ac-2922]MCJ1712643.1 MFS transporter [Curtobacterium sp. VKM Ac-2922]